MDLSRLQVPTRTIILPITSSGEWATPDIYVHLDCHDDISLIALPGRIGDLSHASFVGHLIREGVTVAFYGTNYWSHQMLLFGRSTTCYLRNNLFVYNPFKVHFLDFSRYLVVSMGMYRMVGVEGVRSYIDDCINSGKIEEIYVNEDLGVHHDRVKLYRYGEDIIIPDLSKLLPVDQDLIPGLIIKWDRSDVAGFNGLTLRPAKNHRNNIEPTSKATMAPRISLLNKIA